MSPPPRPLKRHQQRAILHARHTPAARQYGWIRAGLFMRPGTGKTLTAIRIAERYFPNNSLPQYPILVLCRRDDYMTWELELEREGITPDEVLKIQSSRDLILRPPPLRSGDRAPHGYSYEICLFRYILLSWDLTRDSKTRLFLRSIPWRGKIGDELHMIKRAQSKRTQHALSSTAHVHHTLGLTGTPITNSLEDLHTQLRFIAGPQTPLSTTLHDFHLKFYIQAPNAPRSGSYGEWYPKRNVRSLLTQLTRPWCYYVSEDTAIPDLPPIRRVIKSTPLSGMERRHYNNFLENWETTLLTTNLDAPDATDTTRRELVNMVVTQLQKLRQICGGFFYQTPTATAPDQRPLQPEEELSAFSDDTPTSIDNRRSRQSARNRQTIHLRSSKLRLLQSLLFASDAPFAIHKKDRPAIVIACAYTAEIDRIASILPLHAFLTYKGAMTPPQRRIARTRFQNESNIRYFIAQVDMLQGMNELTRANTLIYYSNSDKVVSRDQSELRIRRQGSQIHNHKQITYVDLITEGTIESKQAKSRQTAQEIAQRILENLKGATSPNSHPLRGIIDKVD